MRAILIFACLVLVASGCSGSSSSASESAPPSTDLAVGESESSSTPAEQGSEDGAAGASSDAEALPLDPEERRIALLIADCEAGSDMACDVLIMNTDENSPEEALALRCGGRSDDRVLFCTDGIEHKGRNTFFEEDSEALPGIVTLCEDGDMTACDFLFERSPIGSEYEAIGDGCNYRIDVAEPDCRTYFAEEFGRCPSDLPTPCDN